MNILLDAYYDHNFGDDLFIFIITNRYPQHKFFSFLDGCPLSVQKWTNTIPNLIVLPKCDVMPSSGLFDAYIMIGGDVIPDGGDYTGSYDRRIKYMSAVKESGGYVAMLGFSLYEKYSDKTRGDICKMVSLADDIVVRDQYSYEYLRTISKASKIRHSTDMAFCMDYIKTSIVSTKDILGISIRKKLTSSDDENSIYINNIASLADAYLKERPKGIIRFLGLSYGTSNDKQVAVEIANQMTRKDNVEFVNYEGQIDIFIKQIEECSGIIATRFHAMIIALIMQKPFIPVPYEVKVNHLLDQLSYEGVRIPYGEPVENTQNIIHSLCVSGVNTEKLREYQHRSSILFEGLDRWSNHELLSDKRNKIVELPVACPQKALLVEKEFEYNQRIMEGRQKYEINLLELQQKYEEDLAKYCWEYEQEMASFKNGAAEQTRIILTELETTKTNAESQIQHMQMELEKANENTVIQVGNMQRELKRFQESAAIQIKAACDQYESYKTSAERQLEKANENTVIQVGNMQRELEQFQENATAQISAACNQYESYKVSAELQMIDYKKMIAKQDETIAKQDEMIASNQNTMRMNLLAAEQINSVLHDASGSWVYRIAHVVYHWNCQVIHGTAEERKDYFRKVKRRFLNHATDVELESNPFQRISTILDEADFASKYNK